MVVGRMDRVVKLYVYSMRSTAASEISVTLAWYILHSSVLCKGINHLIQIPRQNTDIRMIGLNAIVSCWWCLSQVVGVDQQPQAGKFPVPS